MKIRVVLFTACAVLLLGVGFAKADEISDLKEQMKALQETTTALNAKIQALEAKQEAHGREIKKVPELAQKISDLKESSLGQLTEGLSVGGHLKMYAFDRTDAKRNAEPQHTNASAGMHHFYLPTLVEPQCNRLLLYCLDCSFSYC